MQWHFETPPPGMHAVLLYKSPSDHPTSFQIIKAQNLTEGKIGAVLTRGFALNDNYVRGRIVIYTLDMVI